MKKILKAMTWSEMIKEKKNGPKTESLDIPIFKGLENEEVARNQESCQ